MSDPNPEFFNFEPQEHYVGIEDIKPLELNGKTVYLDQNELNKSSKFVSTEGVCICYANEKTIQLYEDAMKHVRRYDGWSRRDVELMRNRQCSQKGILVLDCSCPRVKAQINIRVSFPIKGSYLFQRVCIS